MGLFDPAWKKLHVKVCRLYEDIAINSYNGEEIDFLEVTTRALSQGNFLPSHYYVKGFVQDEYKNFKQFNIYQCISDECRKRNPNIQENAIEELFTTLKSRFSNPENELEYFMYFLISKIIEINGLSISRAGYLFEIARGNRPKINGFFRRVNQIAKYNMAKEKYSR